MEMLTGGEILDERILACQAGYKVVGLRKIEAPRTEKTVEGRICRLLTNHFAKKAFGCRYVYVCQKIPHIVKNNKKEMWH